MSCVLFHPPGFFLVDLASFLSAGSFILIPLPRVEDCVDQVGVAECVSKFDLLKGAGRFP